MLDDRQPLLVAQFRERGFVRFCQVMRKRCLILPACRGEHGLQRGRSVRFLPILRVRATGAQSRRKRQHQRRPHRPHERLLSSFEGKRCRPKMPVPLPSFSCQSALACSRIFASSCVNFDRAITSLHPAFRALSAKSV